MRILFPLLCILMALFRSTGAEPAAEKRALSIAIHEPVYAPQIAAIKEGIDSAIKRRIRLVFLDIDVPGGDTLNGKPVVDAIADAGDLKVVAYVEDHGYAAGALIALACSEIVMKRGATLGNAGLEKTDEKRLSPLRSLFQSHARDRGYPYLLAEAMVDPDIEVLEVKTPEGLRYYTPAELQVLLPLQSQQLRVQRTLDEKGKILTLSAQEASAFGFTKRIVSGREECYGAFGLSPAEVESWPAKLPAPPPGRPTAAPGTPPGVAGPETPPPGRVGKKVLVIPVRDDEGMIDLGLAGFIRRKIADARREKVDAIVFEIDTYGGRIDAADLITGYISGAAPIPTIALVLRNATSAGAIIASACQKIYMLPGSTIGSSLPVNLPFGGAADRKYISAVRSQMKALAQKNSLPYRPFECMADPDLVLWECRLDGETQLFYGDELDEQAKKAAAEKRQFEEVRIICGKGDILNLTAMDAERYQVSSGTPAREEDLWPLLGLDRPTILRSRISWPERVARILSNPYISGLLVLLGVIALVIEFITPGFAVTGTIGLLCLGLAFWTQYIVGNANPWEILLFLVGFILLAIEILALPGFGVVGIIGIFMCGASIILAFIPDAYYYDPSLADYPWRMSLVNQALIVFGITAVGSIGGLFVLGWYLPRFSLFRRIEVSQEIRTEIPGAPPVDSRQRLIGVCGKSLTPLRPSGTAKMEGEILDVTTDGDFIPAGERIQIVRIEGNRIVVRAAGTPGA